ncbi:MAG: DNA-binding protein WhiA [Firmicutes bacterium]|nr:DNA-binding protein WhiA [Bacillota bacterium]
MTYAGEAKNELARREFGNRCCQAAELTAFIRLNGNIQISQQHFGLHVVTSSAAIARRIFLLFKKIFKLSSELLVRRKIRLRKNNVYIIRLTETAQVLEVLTKLELLKGGTLTQSISDSIYNNKCCCRAYLRGAFLAAGSVTNPESSYHLEIYTDYQAQAADLVRLMANFDIQAKITTRKRGYLVYLKGSEQIVQFLNIIGAHGALLNFENVRILKDMRNRVNRLVNFETANVNKTVEASVRQLEMIRLIDKEIGLEALDPPLRELARLRLQHPEASLQELGSLLDPPLGKSGVNHRMRKLEKISLRLQKK